MAYDEDLAYRIRELLAELPAASAGGPVVDEKSMFGGLAFLINGHMAVCVSGQGGLMVRVPREHTEGLVAQPHAAPMIMSGRETKGWVRVADTGLADDQDLRRWAARGIDYANGLPPK